MAPGNNTLHDQFPFPSVVIWLTCFAFTLDFAAAFTTSALARAGVDVSSSISSKGETTTNGFFLSSSAEPPAISHTQSRCLFLPNESSSALFVRMLAEPLKGAIGLIPVASVTFPGTQFCTLNLGG